MKGYQVINKYDMSKNLLAVDYYINGKVEQISSHGFSYLDSRNVFKKKWKMGFDTLPANIIEVGFEQTGRVNKDLERILKTFNASLYRLLRYSSSLHVIKDKQEYDSINKIQGNTKMKKVEDG